jgi:hypothetical protein
LRLFLSLLATASLTACPLADAPRADIGLSEAGPGLDAAQQIPDLGSAPLPAVDAGAGLDAAIASDVFGNSDSGGGVHRLDAMSGADALSSSDASLNADVAASADSGLPAEDAGAPMDHAEVSGAVFNVLGRAAVRGVSVCVQNRQPEYPCTTSDVGGQYRLRTPHNAPFVLIFSGGAQPIQPTLVHLQVPLGYTTWNIATLQNSMVGIMMGAMNQPNDVTKGHVSVTVGTAAADGIVGATASMQPMSGAGPVYLNNGGLPDLQATATSSNGTGAFVNVNPGEVSVSVTPPVTHNCPLYPIAVGANGAWRVPVIAGHLSVVVFECVAR